MKIFLFGEVFSGYVAVYHEIQVAKSLRVNQWFAFSMLELEDWVEQAGESPGCRQETTGRWNSAEGWLGEQSENSQGRPSFQEPGLWAGQFMKIVCTLG